MVLWDDKGEESLWLLTPFEFEQLPDGIKLESISGTIKTKGKDEIDMDTRFGQIAWGVRNIKNHPQAKYFTKFLLTK